MPSENTLEKPAATSVPSALLDTLVTSDDRELLRKELEVLKAAVFKVKENNLADTLKSSVRANVAEVIERELRAQASGIQTQAPEKYFESVLEQIDKIPTLQLTIAFEPTQMNLAHFA